VLADCQPEPAPEVDLGFEAAVGPGGAEAFIERVAVWGRRLPRPGDQVFVRAALATVDASGFLPRGHAAGRLERALGQVERSIDPPQPATPVLTTEAVGI